MRKVAWAFSVASVVLGVVALCLAKIHPMQHAGNWTKVAIAVSSSEFGCSVLGFLLNFRELPGKKTWAEVQHAMSKCLTDLLPFDFLDTLRAKPKALQPETDDRAGS